MKFRESLVFNLTVIVVLCGILGGAMHAQSRAAAKTEGADAQALVLFTKLLDS
jgi:hypothetical protein